MAKMVFLEIPNVPKGTVFAEKVTFVIPYEMKYWREYYFAKHKENIFGGIKFILAIKLKLFLICT